MQFAEQFLYHIWDAQHLGENLHTVSGKPLQIMFQGMWNTDSGPDFKNAIIKIGNDVFRGDIEVHLRSYDWISHKHNENKNYNEVILHAVFHHSGSSEFTISENGKKIEIIQLKNYLDKSVSKLLVQYKNKKFKEKDKHCEFFGGLSSPATELIFAKFGKERLEKKIKRFAAELFFTDFDQLLYQGVLEALGYSKNKFQMLQLALHFPVSQLKEFRQNGMNKEELISILLCGTDLINLLPKSFPMALKLKWQEIYACQKFSRKTVELDWNLFRIRPQNHPAVRILQIADFLWSGLESSLFNNILKIFSFPQDRFDFEKFRINLYRLFQMPSEELGEKYKLGKTRIDVIFINIILPLIVLYARKMSFAQLEKIALEIYSQYHGLSENFIVSRMSVFMDKTQKRILRKKAVYQQGILKLYYEFCQYHDCENCLNNKSEILKKM